MTRNRFAWLGGSSDPKRNAASVARAGRHRRQVAAVAREGEAWEQRDRRRFSRRWIP